jgi:hypothetical protein
MSVKSYDDAIISKFRSIFNDNTIYILPVENAIRFSAQLNRDDVKFPMISTTRLGYSIQTQNVNFAAKMIGSFATRDGKNNNIFAQTVPIRIEYQMDVFTVDRQSCDEIVRELIFFFMQHPTLKAHFDYGLNIDHNFNLYLNDEIVDNSDTVEHVNNGVMFRNTLTFYTDDARLFRSKKQIQGEVIAGVKPMFKKLNKF